MIKEEFDEIWVGMYGYITVAIVIDSTRKRQP